MRNYNKDHDENEKEKKPFFLFRKRNDIDGPGVDEDEVKAMEDPSLINFFKLVKRKIGRLVSLNMLYIFGNFPIIFFFLLMTGYFMNEFSANAYSLYPVIHGTALFEPNSPVVATLLGIFGRVTTGFAHTTASVILICLSLLVVLTFGCVNVGTTYILRSMVREEPVFFLSDFKYAIKRNWKQALPMGIIDSIVMAVLVYDIVWFNTNTGHSSMVTPMLIISWATLILYFFMRLYIYLLIITFDLKMTKVLKNAFLFAVIGFKRNIMALLGVIIMAVLAFGFMSAFLPLGIMIIFLFLFSLGGFMGVYAAYPKIKQIMIDPYYAEHPDEIPEDMKDDFPDVDADVL